MGVAVSRRHRGHRSTIASHRGEIAELFVRDAATLCAISLRSVLSRYELYTINALPRRLCYLAIGNLGASVTLLAFWPTSAWFKCRFIIQSNVIQWCCRNATITVCRPAHFTTRNRHEIGIVQALTLQYRYISRVFSFQ